MLNNPYLPQNNMMLPNPFAGAIGAQRATLGLNQIEGFQPVQNFRDDTNTPWTLCKAATNSMVDVPDPKSIQVVDFWNHEFPGLKTKLYVYVVEGVRQPRVETEQPMRVLYQWFSSVWVPSFNPAMITEKEWLKANVYSAPVMSGRESKLAAICKQQASGITQQGQEEESLLKVDELSGHLEGTQG